MSAHAHLMSTGMGPLFDGSTHFLLSPEDLVPAFGLALFAGLRGAEYGRRLLLALPCAWLLGAVLGLGAAATTGSGVVSAVWLLLIGGLVAADAKLTLRAATLLATVLGLHHGYLNAAGAGYSLSSAIMLVGLAATVFVVAALVAALVVQLRGQWTRVAIRVVGSWIAASGLLWMGWAIRGG